MHAKRTSALSIPPRHLDTLDRVTGHLATSAGVVVTHMGHHTRGEMCGILGVSIAITPANLARAQMHALQYLRVPPGMPTIYPLVWHHPRRVTSTTVYVARLITLSRVHAARTVRLWVTRRAGART